VRTKAPKFARVAVFTAAVGNNSDNLGGGIYRDSSKFCHFVRRYLRISNVHYLYRQQSQYCDLFSRRVRKGYGYGEAGILIYLS